MEIIACTNKATIYRDLDGSIAKQYHTADAAERVLQDQWSLGQISKAMKNGKDAEGWLYTAVQPLRAEPSSGTIWMERAPGQALSTLAPSALLDAEYHVGIWLARYHNHLLRESDEGLIFTDMGVHNIFVDTAGKIVTAFDPGRNWGEIGNRYQDVIQHVYSLAVVLLLRGRGRAGAIRSFLYGYASTTGKPIGVRAYATALGRETRRQWAAYGLKSKPKQLAYAAGTVLLAPLFAIYVPGVLACARKRVALPRPRERAGA
jgi:hypothetical protein